MSFAFSRADGGDDVGDSIISDSHPDPSQLSDGFYNEMEASRSKPSGGGVIQVSVLLLLIGLISLVGIGDIVYSAGQYELLIWIVVLSSSVVMFAGLQWWLVPRRTPRSDDTFQLGMRVCGIVSLFTFAVVSIFILSLIYFSLQVNAPFRQHYDTLLSRSANIYHSELPNGIKYSIAHSDYKRDKFSVVVRVDVGALTESDDELGLAHLAQHVAIESSGTDTASEKRGARVRSHTTQRTTTFALFDMPFSSSSSLGVFSLLSDLIFRQVPTEAQVKLQKLVLSGEERLFNSTKSLVQRMVYCDHFGPKSRLCRRLQFADNRLGSLSAHDVARFYDRNYHPQRVEIFMAGDFDIGEAEMLIKKIFVPAMRIRGNATVPQRVVNPSPPAPTKPLSIQPLKGMDGLQLSLIVSRPYSSPVRTANYHRRKMLNRVFFGVLLNQFAAHMDEYDLSKSEIEANNVDLFASVREDFEISRTVHTLRLRLKGHPEKGSWRRYLEVLFVELRRLAEQGPDPDVLEELLDTGRMVLEAHEAFSSFEDSARLVGRMVGNSDPAFMYLDAMQQFETHAPFLNRGFVDPAWDHVQTEAQLLWKAVVEIVNNSHPFSFPPYDSVTSTIRSQSLSVLTDNIDKYVHTPSKSYVSARDLAMLVNKVLDAVLVSADDASTSAGDAHSAVIRLEDVFIDRDDQDGVWEQSGEVAATLERDEDTKVVRERLHERSGHDQKQMDTLPSSGSLVDQRRMVLKHSLHHRDYELLETLPMTGAKRFRLSNGLRVNLKQRLSGKNALPCDAPGIVEIEIVSLGGRATQPASLKGACELIDMNVPSGFMVEYWNDAAGKDELDEVYFDVHTVDSYFGRAGRPRLRCGKEHFTIRKRLHSKCINFPQVKHCDRVKAHYTKKLESVRLAMSPVFDANSVDRAFKSFERLLARAESRSDPNEFMKWRTNWKLQHPWMQIDSRTQTVHPWEIHALDPVQIGLWVREQFTVDRMEVNVVGDFDEVHLLRELNRMFGTMPLSRNRDVVPETVHAPHTGQAHRSAQSPRSRQRLGHDIYNMTHDRHFRLDVPSIATTAAELARGRPSMPSESVTNCTLPSLRPGRAFVAMAVLISADYSSVRGHQKALLTDVLFQHTLLDKLRRDLGFVYSIESEPFTSHLFQRFGYYQLQWVVGLDLKSHSSSSVSAHSQIRDTLQAVQDVLNSTHPFTQATFDVVKASLISRMKSQLQESSSWLSVLQGISLTPPVWHQHSMFRTIKDLAQTNVLDGLERIELSDATLFFLEHLSSSMPVSLAIVETVAHGSTGQSVLGGVPCKWEWSQ